MANIIKDLLSFQLIGSQNVHFI